MQSKVEYIKQCTLYRRVLQCNVKQNPLQYTVEYSVVYIKWNGENQVNLFCSSGGLVKRGCILNKQCPFRLCDGMSGSIWIPFKLKLIFYDRYFRILHTRGFLHSSINQKNIASREQKFKGNRCELNMLLYKYECNLKFCLQSF